MKENVYVNTREGLRPGYYIWYKEETDQCHTGQVPVYE